VVDCPASAGDGRVDVLWMNIWLHGGNRWRGCAGRRERGEYQDSPETYPRWGPNPWQVKGGGAKVVAPVATRQMGVRLSSAKTGPVAHAMDAG
jgi:hypothetical protein